MLAASAPPWTAWEVAVFVGLVALAILLRVWDLQNVPYGVHPDETYIGRTALDG
jgi:hypothetical protein